MRPMSCQFCSSHILSGIVVLLSHYSFSDVVEHRLNSRKHRLRPFSTGVFGIPVSSQRVDLGSLGVPLTLDLLQFVEESEDVVSARAHSLFGQHPPPPSPLLRG